MAEKALKGMFNILGHLGNANQSKGLCDQILHPSEWLRLKTQGTVHISGCVAKRILLCCWWEYKLVQPLQKSIWQFLRKLGIVLSEDQSVLILSIYQKDAEPSYKDACSTMFIAASFLIVRNWKQSRCPSADEWIKKQWYIYTMEYYFTNKNKDTMNFLGK